MVPDNGAKPGLRERKKLKTRSAIQQHALRLFREQGYAATTVEQIAEAAEISPSTFFRYFPTKEDVVMMDDYDPVIIEAFRSQPSELNPIQALRRAMKHAFADLSTSELDAIRDRTRMFLEVPELQTVWLNHLSPTMRVLDEILADRVGRTPDDFAIRTFTGAVQGVMLSVALHWAEYPGTTIVTLIDEALGLLEAGLPL